MSSFCLHSSPEAPTPLGNSIVDNPKIQSRPQPRLHSSHIMTSKQSRFESCRLQSVGRMMKEQVYHSPNHDVGLNDLKQRLLDVWAAVHHGSEDYMYLFF